jgi:hypothetical protein
VLRLRPPPRRRPRRLRELGHSSCVCHSRRESAFALPRATRKVIHTNSTFCNCTHSPTAPTFISTDDEQQVGSKSPAPLKDTAADANRKAGRRYRRRINRRRDPEHDPLAPPKEAAADASRRPTPLGTAGGHRPRIALLKHRDEAPETPVSGVFVCTEAIRENSPHRLALTLLPDSLQRISPYVRIDGHRGNPSARACATYMRS